MNKNMFTPPICLSVWKGRREMNNRVYLKCDIFISHKRVYVPERNDGFHVSEGPTVSLFSAGIVHLL
jgi:hypothetical protein